MNHEYPIPPHLREKISAIYDKKHFDHWKPVYSMSSSMYDRFIKPYTFHITIIVVLAVLLLFRYRVVKNRRQLNEPQKKPVDQIDLDAVLNNYIASQQ